MSVFGNMMRRWARKRFRREAENTLKHLKTLDNNSMGLVLAISAHQRNALIKDGNEMRDLSKVAAAYPMYQHDLSKAVSVLMKNKRPHDALGLVIWVHSLRAVADRSLSEIVNAIWRELERGRPHVAKARELVRGETEFELDISHAGETPAEFRLSE